MNRHRIEGLWHQIKGGVKERWGNLTDDALDQLAGKREQLLGKLQQQSGISLDEAERQIGDREPDLDWQAGFDDM